MVLTTKQVNIYTGYNVLKKDVANKFTKKTNSNAMTYFNRHIKAKIFDNMIQRFISYKIDEISYSFKTK